MKSKKLTLFFSICIVLILVTTLVLSACAKEEAPAAPATPAPAKPAPTTPAPAKPAPTTPAPAKPAPAPAAEVFKWKWQANAPVNSSEYDSGVFMAEVIEQATNGRMLITPYAQGVLLKTTDYLDGARLGTVEIVSCYGGYWKGFMPEAGIECGIPGVWRSWEEVMTLFYHKGLIDPIREAYAEHGVYYWGPESYSGVPMWATRPVRTKADLQGLKIRAVGELESILNQMGAAATFIPHEESYTALQLGTIDAYSTATWAVIGFKHYEVTPYLMQPAWLFPGINNYVLSNKALDTLPDDLVAIMKAMGPYRGMVRTWLDHDLQAECFDQVKQFGVEIVQMEDSMVQEAQQLGLEILQTYRDKNERCAEMVDIIMDYIDNDRGEWRLKRAGHLQ